MKHYTLTAEQMQQVREKLHSLSCLGNGDKFGNSIGNVIAQEALALLDAAMQAPEATDREGWLTREEIANLFRPLPAGEKWATIPEAELQALCRMALFALSVPAEATAGGDSNKEAEKALRGLMIAAETAYRESAAQGYRMKAAGAEALDNMQLVMEQIKERVQIDWTGSANLASVETTEIGIRKRLADAWDDGHYVGYREKELEGVEDAPSNPWRD